jgi:Skp family chaperone for outer membrane proteins
MNTTFTKGALRALAATVLLAAPAAQAQAPTPSAAASAPVAPATPAAPAIATPAAAAAIATPAASKGPLVPGVCLLSQEALIARSKVGQGATARLRELAGQVQANLNAEKARLEARGKALNDKRATLTPLQIQAQSQALNQSAQALQAKAGERSQQIDATKTRVLNQVLQQAQPFITQAYAAHGCGLLFAREAVLTGNLGNDLTDEVLAALDAKGTPITFDLEPAQKAR